MQPFLCDPGFPSIRRRSKTSSPALCNAEQLPEALVTAFCTSLPRIGSQACALLQLSQSTPEDHPEAVPTVWIPFKRATRLRSHCPTCAFTLARALAAQNVDEHEALTLSRSSHLHTQSFLVKETRIAAKRNRCSSPEPPQSPHFFGAPACRVSCGLHGSPDRTFDQAALLMQLGSDTKSLINSILESIESEHASPGRCRAAQGARFLEL
ncbi:hypothetical protein B0J12DRAFT_77128 [Macrophomina phaseolina]|uniref:Uncharacterized protein n=1 Tax=Macrophomina phaseolina TaxID=35725 RepID=A0ABQ8GC59_9PEZI|nr:hypothetical protein B0J12DRAFT_77128 [Macrophomina phaseolina]